jgi:ABC-type sugar transport system ATPase subunit
VGAKAELYRVIRGLCSDGLGVIVTSSELPELLTLSDRIMVLSEGRKTAEFAIADATQERIMEAATGGWQPAQGRGASSSIRNPSGFDLRPDA